MCMILYGVHDCMSQPIPGHLHIDSVGMCKWMNVSSVRLRRYLKECQRLGMLADLKFTKGSYFAKVVPTEFFEKNE